MILHFPEISERFGFTGFRLVAGMLITDGKASARARITGEGEPTMIGLPERFKPDRSSGEEHAMSGDGTRERIGDKAEDIRQNVSDAAGSTQDEVETKTRGFREDATNAIGDANDKVADTRSRVDEEVDTAKARAHDQAEDFSDKLSDALNEAGEKFGGLIDKAKSAFGDDPSKR
jgi:hypothetical protein